MPPVYELTKFEVPEAWPVDTGWGQSKGVSCPNCGGRDYPLKDGVNKCELCGMLYKVSGE